MMSRLFGPFALGVIFLLITTALSSPAITSYDKVVSLPESTATNLDLSTITCTDTDGDSTRTLIKSVVPGSPCGGCFSTTACGADECLQYRTGLGRLEFSSANFYLITIICDDGNETPAEEVIMVNIIPNSPPKFNPATLTDDQEVSATKTLGDTVASAPAVDDDGDTLSYSLTVIPSSAQSAFTIDTSGTITALVDLRTLCRSFVTFEVTVNDGSNTAGPKVINLSFTDNHVKPIATNLNTELQIPETTTGRIYIYSFITDETLTYTTTSTNADGFAQYEANSETLSVIATLDYETESLRVTELLISATDGYCTSDTYTLTLTVTDVNEAPVISNDETNIELCEGRVEFLPPFTWYDPDEYDYHQWTYFGDNNNDGLFFVHPVTGTLGTNLDYDVDPDYDKPKTYGAKHTYKFEVTDKGGLTATATVSATFLDCNDNAPRFTQAFFTFTANECTAPGSTLGRVSAIDADSDREGNNVIEFSGAAGAVEIGATGAVILTEALPAGTVIVFDAWATDQGLTPGPLRSEQPAKISVVFGVCPDPAAATTAAPTDDTASASSNSDTNLPWIVVAGLLGAALVGTLGFMLWKYSGVMGQSCTCDSRVSAPRRSYDTSSSSRQPSRKPKSLPSDSFFY